MIAGVASLAGWPASVAVAELASRWGRSRVIVGTCVVSVGVCIAPAVMGLVLDLFGGSDSASGWTAAFLIMAIGSSVTAAAMWSERPGRTGKSR